MYYFAYGSNMLRERLEKDRLGSLEDLGIGILYKYKIKFNKQSLDGSGKTNLIQDDNSQVFGVIYKLSEEQISALDKFEPGYSRITLDIKIGEVFVDMETYIAQKDKINNNLLPTKEYLGYLIQGAKEHDFPLDYIHFLENTKYKI